MNSELMKKKVAMIGLLGAISVGLGALGAHALKNQLAGGHITPDQLNGFDTAVKYQMYHTLGMLLAVLLQQHVESKYLNWAYRLFFLGIILFSGSLYLLCTRGLTGMEFLKVLGPITPLGGVAFMLGWLCFLGPLLKKVNS